MKYFFFAVLLIPGCASAQLDITVNSGIGMYRMEDMKDLQKYRNSQFPVETRITESFPSYWFYESSVKTVLDNGWIFGGSASYGSTGGRIYYSDYSGMVSFDQLLQYYSISSIIGMAKKFNEGKLILLGTMQVATVVTKLKIENEAIINNQPSSESSAFRSLNWALQPTVSLTRRFWFTGLSINLGYNQTIVFGKLKDDNDNTTLHTDWSGLRLSGGVSFYFHRFAPTN